ncbi:Scr1 family TA system antitoxin-like transcriptional regulator [Kitasatospora sp. NPDC092286]|uniref:Scr1 family TA system antitoxin-like transcriptional regulator n=1 Tax=Kitasatospora sp. NPDC092286 TaxID=3364087 RepID=UPI0038298F4E
MIIRPPFPPAALADRVLGAHLRHLRECRGEQLAAVADRLPARLRLTPDDLAATEAGRGTILLPASVTGEGPALARAYGAGQVAADDWRTCAEERGRRATVGFPDGFYDPGPGWPHRYQILEERASSVLLTAGGRFLPVPLLTDRLEEELWNRRPQAPSRRGHKGVLLGALPGTGCTLCQVYRGDLLTDHAALARWQRDAHRARARAFAARIRTPNAPATTVLLDEAVLHRRTGGMELHTEQMAHLAALAECTALRIRVVPMATGMPVLVEHVQLVVDGDVLTVGLSEWEAAYRSGPDPRLAGLEEHSLGEGASLGLLRQAAGGTLHSEGIGR